MLVDHGWRHRSLWTIPPSQPDDQLILRHRCDGFDPTSLQPDLEERGETQAGAESCRSRRRAATCAFMVVRATNRSGGWVRRDLWESELRGRRSNDQAIDRLEVAVEAKQRAAVLQRQRCDPHVVRRYRAALGA